MENPSQLDLMRRVADLYEAFSRREMSWHEWQERTEPLLRTLDSGLHYAEPADEAKPAVA